MESEARVGPRGGLRYRQSAVSEQEIVMQLRHLTTVTQPATGEGGDGVKMSKVMAVAWAPNNRKLAVCTVRENETAQSTRYNMIPGTFSFRQRVPCFLYSGC